MNKLTHVEDRVIVSIDHDRKNWHQIEGGPRIKLERKYDCFNERYTKPVNAIVVSASDISDGTEVIVHHTCIHETNLINNYKPLSGKDEASEVKYYSVSENEVFAWHDESTQTWQPMKGYDFALRIYQPYKGILEGVEPTLIKQALWITTGEYKNKACIVLQASDYQLIFQGRNDTEMNIIRLRSEDRPKEQRESEIVAIHNSYTEKVLHGDLIVGLTKTDAKPINEYICQ